METALWGTGSCCGTTRRSQQRHSSGHPRTPMLERDALSQSVVVSERCATPSSLDLVREAHQLPVSTLPPSLSPPRVVLPRGSRSLRRVGVGLGGSWSRWVPRVQALWLRGLLRNRPGEPETPWRGAASLIVASAGLCWRPRAPTHTGAQHCPARVALPAGSLGTASQPHARDGAVTPAQGPLGERSSLQTPSSSHSLRLSWLVALVPLPSPGTTEPPLVHPRPALGVCSAASGYGHQQRGKASECSDLWR